MRAWHEDGQQGQVLEVCCGAEHTYIHTCQGSCRAQTDMISPVACMTPDRHHHHHCTPGPRRHSNFAELKEYVRWIRPHKVGEDPHQNRETM